MVCAARVNNSNQSSDLKSAMGEKFMGADLHLENGQVVVDFSDDDLAAKFYQWLAECEDEALLA